MFYPFSYYNIHSILQHHTIYIFFLNPLFIVERKSPSLWSHCHWMSPESVLLVTLADFLVSSSCSLAKDAILSFLALSSSAFFLWSLASLSTCILLCAITWATDSIASSVMTSQWSHSASIMSLGIKVTRFAWMVHNWLFSNNPIKYASLPSCKALMAVD